MKKFIFLFVLLLIAGCSLNASSESLTDDHTSEDIPIVENSETDMITHHHNYDNMDRGNHDYYDKPLAIDTNPSELSRGDVVFFENENGEKDISRVVALPGEKIHISKGQVYIDGKKLDSFYGKAHRAGSDKDQYFEKMDSENNVYNKEGMLEVFETSLKEITLADDEYFFIGDDWLRSKMNVLNENQIIGKVVGYTE